MQEFWINNGWNFIWIELFIIVISFAVIPYYTGSGKKFDLMIQDIKEKGEVTFETIQFDSFLNNQGLDPFRFSMLTHLFFRIPSKKKSPQLYDNEDFLRQYKKVKAYRKFYKLILSLWLANLLLIIIMTHVFSQNIK